MLATGNISPGKMLGTVSFLKCNYKYFRRVSEIQTCYNNRYSEQFQSKTRGKFRV